MRDGHNGYAPSLGVEEGIQAIAGEAERRGIRNVQSIFVTAGVSEGVELCLTSLCNTGEDVLTPAPEYPLYSAVLAKIESPINAYYLDEEKNWEPNVEEMASKITPKTRGIVVINPNNPTGAVYSRPTLEAICDLARRRNLVIFADEIYDKLILDDGVEHISLASLAPDVPVITFSGLSKPYLAPGWRIGWAICSGPKDALKPYIEGVHKLLRARLCCNAPMQYAIKPALEGPQDHVKEMNGKLRRRRDLTVQVGELHAARKLRLAQGHVLCVSQARHSRRRSRFRQRRADGKAGAGGARQRLRPEARHQTFPHRLPS